jgi:AcrR family transcriptional regulator
MAAQASATTDAPSPQRTGRPLKRAGAVPTRDRLIAAAIDLFVEHGFSGTHITDIAARAGISGPAVYKHFDGKADLLIEAARRSLKQVGRQAASRAHTPTDVARIWLSPGFAQTRRLLLELHLAATREEDLLDLLAQWHAEQAGAWQSARGDDVAQIKAFYLLLLGLSQVDVLASLHVSPALLQDHVDRMVNALFPA